MVFKPYKIGDLTKEKREQIIGIIKEINKKRNDFTHENNLMFLDTLVEKLRQDDLLIEVLSSFQPISK